MANPNQYFLLADHIKLSLLERQRAVSLKLPATSQDEQIASSLASLKDGLTNLAQECQRLSSSGTTNAHQQLSDTLTTLQSQHSELASQFASLRGQSSVQPITSPTITQPNDPALRTDFDRATIRPGVATHSSFKKPRNGDDGPSPTLTKSVRFTDARQSAEIDANRAALFPYRDDENDQDGEGGDASTSAQQGSLSNQQIHAFHSRVLREQDEALDRLGASIGRQRELTIAIGNELDDQVLMLDDVDTIVDRHQGRLDKAKRGLRRVATEAKGNWQCTTITVLIIILVLLIVVFK